MGSMQPDGSWRADKGSSFRSLTAQEVSDLKVMAETTTPRFEDVVETRKVADPKTGVISEEQVTIEYNTPFDQHHPVAREVWENRGLKPK